eukprot:1157711-Pelagomonas_calceolata.AAC.13
MLHVAQASQERQPGGPEWKGLLRKAGHSTAAKPNAQQGSGTGMAPPSQSCEERYHAEVRPTHPTGCTGCMCETYLHVPSPPPTMNMPNDPLSARPLCIPPNIPSFLPANWSLALLPTSAALQLPTGYKALGDELRLLFLRAAAPPPVPGWLLERHGTGPWRPAACGCVTGARGGFVFNACRQVRSTSSIRPRCTRGKPRIVPRGPLSMRRSVLYLMLAERWNCGSPYKGLKAGVLPCPSSLWSSPSPSLLCGRKACRE